MTLKVLVFDIADKYVVVMFYFFLFHIQKCSFFVNMKSLIKKNSVPQLAGLNVV